ncbi:NAD(P)-binding protein [Nocardia beijingensis]
MSTHLTVIGGGLAGLTAAVEAAEAGARVRLFEAHQTVGGRALPDLAAGTPRCAPGESASRSRREMSVTAPVGTYIGRPVVCPIAGCSAIRSLWRRCRRRGERPLR